MKQTVLRLLTTLCAAAALASCAHDPYHNTEQRVGIIKMSPPIVVPGENFENTFKVDTSKIDFEKALAEAALAQSGAFRRHSDQQRIVGKVAADLLKMQALEDAAAAGVAPPEGSTTPPSLPTTAPSLKPPDGFLSGALAAQPVAVPFSDRMQTAFSDALLARISGDLPNVLNKHKETHDIYFLLSSMTVIPGKWTEFNGTADLRVKFDINGEKDTKFNQSYEAPQKNFKEGRIKEATMIDDFFIVPVFPTRQTATLVDDAAGLKSVELLLEALIAYGPAQGSGQYERAFNDLKRLTSARQTVTLMGSMLDERTANYRVKGLRAANPIVEKNPTASLIMEPITLPVIHMVAIKKLKCPKEAKECTETLKMNVEYAGRWTYLRSWYNPKRWFNNDWKTMRFTYAPENKFFDFLFPRQGEKEYWEVESSGNYSSSIVRTTKNPSPPDPLIISPVGSATIEVKSALDQVLVLKGEGSQAKAFFLDGYQLPIIKADKVKPQNAQDKTKFLYQVGLTQSLLTDIAFALNANTAITPQDLYLKTTVTEITMKLRGINDEGGSSPIDVNLNYTAILPRHRFLMNEQNGATSLESFSKLVLPFDPAAVLKKCVVCPVNTPCTCP